MNLRILKKVDHSKELKTIKHLDHSLLRSQLLYKCQLWKQKNKRSLNETEKRALAKITVMKFYQIHLQPNGKPRAHIDLAIYRPPTHLPNNHRPNCQDYIEET